MKLEGKTALVTGASRGIGAAIASLFAREGANVVVTARTAQVEQVANQIRAEGGKAEAMVGDIVDDAHVRAIMQVCRGKFGGLNIVVNNAGLMMQGKLGMVRLDDVRRLFEVNVIATYNIIQYAPRLFAKGSGGAIINLSSIAATRGIEGLVAYSGSKGAIVGITKAAAKELAPLGIRVNALAPGFIDTEMTKSFSEETVQRTIGRISLKRMGTPQEVASAALFLASDDSSYVTGQVFGVDGGIEA